MVEDAMLRDGLEDTMATVDGNIEVKMELIYHEETQENGDIAIYGPTVASKVVEETTSDEGWQEANPKGRSWNAAGRKSGRKRPELAKLNINNSDYSNFRERNYRQEIISPAHKTTPRANAKELSPMKQSKTRDMSIVDDSVKAKVSLSKASSASGSLTAMASKSVSYKEVAAAPPGTVLKPLLEPVEESNEKKPEIQMCSILSEPSKEEESSNTCVVDNIPGDGEEEGTHESGTQSDKSGPEPEEVHSNQEKFTETNGSKLSAAAEPFSPGALSMAHPIDSVAGTSIYDIRASQGMLAEPVAPPLAARVPCGPRSPLYYRTNQSYRMRQGFLKYQTCMTMPSRSMNPHAPEFVPRRVCQTNPGNEVSSVSTESNSLLETSKVAEEKFDKELGNEVNDHTSEKTSSNTEKAELARQILLSFIVKSVQHNIDPGSESVASEKKSDGCENSSDAIANDSAIIKILDGNEGKTEVTKSVDHEQPKTINVNKNKSGDGEGFIVVTKRRRNRQQLPSGVNGLYNQQSICASVR